MLKCFYHPHIDATAGCIRCRHLICKSCHVIREGKSYCKYCYHEMMAEDNACAKKPQDEPDIKVLLKKMLTRLGK